ncbi:hypothetical protein D3C81_1227100 [compost metagenome]
MAAPLAPLETEHHQQRQGERQQQVEGAEHDQGGEHVDGRNARQRGDERHLQHAQPARGVGQQGQREGGEEHAEHHQIAGVVRGRQGEVDDRRGAQQLQRAGQQLAGDDAQARVLDMQLAAGPGLELAPGAEHIQADQQQQQQADGHRERRRDVEDLLGQAGAQHQHAAAGEQGAEAEREGAEEDQQADFLRTEALAAVGAIAHHRAGEHRGADVVGQGVGGERTEGDEAPGNPLAQMGEGDVVVPGQGKVGAQGGAAGQQPVQPGDGPQAAGHLVEGDAVQFAIQQKAGQHHGTQTNQRPQQVAAFHLRFGDVAGQRQFLVDWVAGTRRCASQGRLLVRPLAAVQAAQYPRGEPSRSTRCGNVQRCRMCNLRRGRRFRRPSAGCRRSCRRHRRGPG